MQELSAESINTDFKEEIVDETKETKADDIDAESIIKVSDHNDRDDTPNDDNFAGFEDNSGWDDDQIDLDQLDKKAGRIDAETENEVCKSKSKEQYIKDEKDDFVETQAEEHGGGWGGWDDDVLDLGDEPEIEDKVKETTPIFPDTEISGPQALPPMLAPIAAPLLTQDEPPASLISNVSFNADGWGDDGFGWGNDEDLPGNLRLSEERNILAVSPALEITSSNQIDEEDGLLTRSSEEASSNLEARSSPQGEWLIVYE